MIDWSKKYNEAEKLNETQVNIKKAEFQKSLEALDLASLRALRAIAVGEGVPADIAELKQKEAEAKRLRSELDKLPKKATRL
jgi:hypothetical protein